MTSSIFNLGKTL